MSKMSAQDLELLEELCRQHGVDPQKVVRLLETIRDYEFKDRRTGVYDALREVLRGASNEKNQ